MSVAVAPAPPAPAARPEAPVARVLIVGAGFSGIGLAMRLRRAGMDDVVVLERAASPGGTWRDNTYPGCACDVPSVLYSLASAPNPDWSRAFSPQAEIEAYLLRCAADSGVLAQCTFGEAVSAATWDAAAGHWRVTGTTRTWRAQHLVLANGPLSEPVLPDIPGLGSFAGPSFHSARWAADVPLAGRRVAVIGTGASAIQFVPKVQPQVAHLDLFQRTPPWIVPRRDGPVPAWRRAIRRRVPGAYRAERALLYAVREATFFPFRHPRAGRAAEWLARRHLAAQVRDPALRAALTPAYRIGCKRILVSDDYYPAVAQPNVSVVTDAVAEVVPTGVRTADGRVRPADVLILGTGFRVTDPPLAPAVRGRAGRTLAEAWRGSPSAYMGTTMAGFPNLYLLLGPNTGLGHSSVLLMAEAQMEHIVGVLALAASRGGAVEPDAAVQGRYQAWLDGALAPTVWNSGGCRSWYLDATGRNSTLWPFGVGRFRRTVSRVDPAAYVPVPRAADTGGGDG